ncbi:MAG: 4-(cytidine 5'-diphospho)-2-C-methyl-D-erythritol kinase [Treponema sp.]|nr:4-(cytidine 5'-diphospho)-2-C-methyl-D-erythritol kinase [Treponema sp.]
MRKSLPGECINGCAGVCTIEAPCKINLHLGIGEKRSDGFHTLESIFATLAFCDTLRFECTEKEGDSTLLMNWEIPEEPILPSKNLVMQAVSLFRGRTNYKKGLKIAVTKRIPAGAGLGGGSSDAASSLLALNLLAGTALPIEKLMEMAATLGSDVPFFLSGGAAYVGGRGESIEPVEIRRKLWVILCKPPFSVSTSFAFRALDQVRESQAPEKSLKLNPFDGFPKETFPKQDVLKKDVSKKRFSRKRLIQALADDPKTWPFYNDFLTIFSNLDIKEKIKEPDLWSASHSGVYQAILQALDEAGASFTGLSGSGSCCFGVFGSKTDAEKAEKVLNGDKFRSFLSSLGLSEQENFVRLTFFLARKTDPVLQY